MKLRIAELIKERGLSQTKVALDLGVKPSTVSKWANNQSAPPTQKLAEIARYFGVEPYDLFSDLTLTKAQREIVAKLALLSERRQRTVNDLIDDLLEDPDGTDRR